MNERERKYLEMEIKNTAAEDLEGYSFGKPCRYTSDHPNLLAEGLPVSQPENFPLMSGFARFVLSCIALGLIVYGIKGLLTDDLYLPGKRTLGRHYHGHSAWLMFGMLVSLAGGLLAFTFSEFNAVRREIKNRTLLISLFISTVVFMLAGLMLDALYR